jgi:signal transduction histidine kinase
VNASRARIVAAADQARRRIERNLHDGAPQRLVSLGLRLRAVQAAIPPQFGFRRAVRGRKRGLPRQVGHSRSSPSFFFRTSQRWK